MAYIEVHLSILHPNLSDFTGTRQVDRRIFANAYTAFGEVSKWAIGAHIASSEKAAPGRIAFQHLEVKLDATPNAIEAEVKALCDELFASNKCKSSLDSMSNSAEVLFRPVPTSPSPTVADDMFLRHYIIMMIKQCAEMPVLREGSKIGSNVDFQTGDPNKWFLGPKKTVALLADCIRGLREFVELVQLSTVNFNVEDLAEMMGANDQRIQELSRTVELVFSLIRGMSVAEYWLLGNVLVRLQCLDKEQLGQTITNTAAELEESINQLDSVYEEILALNAGTNINTGDFSTSILRHAGESADHAKYLSQLAETERLAKRRETALLAVATGGSAGVAVLSYMAVAVHPAVGVVVVVSLVGTAVLGAKTVISINDMRKSQEVRQVASNIVRIYERMWRLLRITLFRLDGELRDDDEGLNRFATQILRVFNIEDIVGQLILPEYVKEVVSEGRSAAQGQMRELAAAVQSRRNHIRLPRAVGRPMVYSSPQDILFRGMPGRYAATVETESVASEKTSTLSVEISEFPIASSTDAAEEGVVALSEISLSDAEQWRELGNGGSSQA